MKPHPRIRKTIKWSATAVTALLVVMWIGSFWWKLRCYGSWGWFDLGGGVVHLGNMTPGTPWHLEFAEYTFGPTIHRFSNVNLFLFDPRTSTLLFPLWWAIPLPLLASVGAWYQDARCRRRSKYPHCPKCGYNRTGLPLLAACPECGSGSEA